VDRDDDDAALTGLDDATMSSALAASPCCDLPEDVYLLIFSLLDPVSLSRAARVCRLWRQIVASKTLWRHVRLPFLSKQKLRQFISRRMDVDCKQLSISGSCVLPTDNSSSLKSSAGRRCVLSAAIVESLQAKASKLEKLEIRQDNLATAMEVSLSDLVQLQLSSIAATECYVAIEWFLGGSVSFSSRAHLQCLDLSGSNRIDDHFICTNCDVAFMQIYRAERLHLSRQQSIQGTPNPAGDIQDYIPTEDLPDAANVFLLQFPHLKTLKLNQLYRLTCRGIKVLTSCFNDAGERVSLRGRLERLELMGNGLGDDTVNHLRSMTSLRHLRLDGPQAMTPGALEHLLYMPYLESLSLDKMIDVDKITEKLGIRKADEIMDRLMFRIFQDFSQLRRLSFIGLFATSPPPAAMKLTWPFLIEQLPKLEAVAFCEKRHFLPLRPKKKALEIKDCHTCLAGHP